MARSLMKDLLNEYHSLWEGGSMKLELTPREVELLLMIINDAASGDFSMGDAPILSGEESAIVKKLEAALDNWAKKNSGEVHPGHTSKHTH